MKLFELMMTTYMHFSFPEVQQIPCSESGKLIWMLQFKEAWSERITFKKTFISIFDGWIEGSQHSVVHAYLLYTLS